MTDDRRSFPRLAGDPVWDELTRAQNLSMNRGMYLRAAERKIRRLEAEISRLKTIIKLGAWAEIPTTCPSGQGPDGAAAQTHDAFPHGAENGSECAAASPSTEYR